MPTWWPIYTACKRWGVLPKAGAIYEQYAVDMHLIAIYDQEQRAADDLKKAQSMPIPGMP